MPADTQEKKYRGHKLQLCQSEGGWINKIRNAEWRMTNL